MGQVVRLSAVPMLVTLLVFVGYGWGAVAVAPRARPPAVFTWRRRTFAAAFVALGAKLATAERRRRPRRQPMSSTADGGPPPDTPTRTPSGRPQETRWPPV